MAVQGLDRLKRRLARLPKEQLDAAALTLAKGVAEMAEAVRRAAPMGHGKGAGDLKRSVGSSTAGAAPATRATGAFRPAPVAAGDPLRGAGLRAVVWAGDDDAYYARWVEFGTQPHSIAKGANTKSGKHQSKGVMHPGARAQPFFYPTVRARKKLMKGRMVRAANKAVKSVYNTRASKG